MSAVNLAEAKARLSELVARAENGEDISIMRRGKPVARIVPPERVLEKVDVEALKRLAARLPYQAQSAGEFVRQMRDEDRY